MTMRIVRVLAIVAAAAAAVACSGPKGWSVKGDGAESGARIAVEANNGTSWYVLDSITADDQGRFAYNAEDPAAYTDIMRLVLPDGRGVYFPVDSVDAVEVTLGPGGHNLGGTPMAVAFAAVDSIVAAADDLAGLQRKLVGFVTSDTTGIVAYYTVRKSKGNQPVFDPMESMGNRVYGAAAQVFATYHPLDPRGAVLKQDFFAGRVALGLVPQQELEIEAVESGIIDITRYDDKGVSRSLAEIAGKNGPVVLSFTDYSAQGSPAYNAVLFDVYDKYKDRGLQIYQLSFDANEVAWREAARNLPWITVWNAPTDGMDVVAHYNVGGLPLTYVIDRNGDIGARVVNPADIEKTVAKYF